MWRIRVHLGKEQGRHDTRELLTADWLQISHSHMRHGAQVCFLRLGQPRPAESHQSLPLTKWSESDWLFETELALPDSREILMESGSFELETWALAWKWTPNLGAKSRCALVNPNPQLQGEAFGYWVPHRACFVLTLFLIFVLKNT